jgi:hypothetical protein
MNFREDGDTIATTLKREQRSETLIARFVKGFAAGWRMAVPEVFKEALDISYTSKMRNKREYYTWTQGVFFNFKQGDILYDSPEAYEAWNSPSDKISLMVQVEMAYPVAYDDPEVIKIIAPWMIVAQTKPKYKKPKETWASRVIVEDFSLNPGYVRFKATRFGKSGGPEQVSKEYECTQNAFVSFLQTGVLDRQRQPPVDLFKSWDQEPIQAVTADKDAVKRDTQLLPGFELT